MKKSIKTTLLIAFLAIALFFGWQMYDRFQNEELWGHKPLFFFIAGWAFIVLLLWKKFTSAPKGLRWFLMSTASGILLSIGFPPIPMTMLMFVGWVPLLLVEREISEGSESPQKLLLFRYAYHTFVVWNILTTYWVTNTAFFAGIVAIWLNSLFMSVPFLLFHQTRKITPRLGYIAFIAFWMSFELLHLHWEISWPWLNLGNAFAHFPQWIQWYEYTGTFGGTLWILLANVFIVQLLNNRIPIVDYWHKRKWQLLKIAALILLPIITSFGMYLSHEDKGTEVEVVVVQPNLEPHYQKFQLPEEIQQDRYRRLAESALTPETDYLVFPETAFSAGNKDFIPVHQSVSYYRQLLSSYPNLKLVTGIVAYKVFAEGETHTRSTRKQLMGADTIYWEAYNSAIQLTSGVDSIPFYIKSKLVPGAEILPYHEVFFFLKPLVESLDGSVEGHGKQPFRTAFKSNSGIVAPVICYESVYGDYHANYIRQAGAEATFIMTNDGWWDRTAGHKQHLEFASLRAIETRRSIARSANTGISCFINQRGDILQPTKYGEEAAIRGKIAMNRDITFYVQWGDLIARIGLFASAILLLNTFVKSFLKKRNQSV